MKQVVYLGPRAMRLHDLILCALPALEIQSELGIDAKIFAMRFACLARKFRIDPSELRKVIRMRRCDVRLCPSPHARREAKLDESNNGGADAE